MESKIILTTEEINKVVDELKEIKAKLSKMEAKEKRLVQALHNHMLDNEILCTKDGEELATWKYAKPTVFFDAKKLEREKPDVYVNYMGVREGSRRLLIK